MHTSQTWRTYYVKLLVLVQARHWLSATERLDAAEESPPTPKTTVQLALAIKNPKAAEYVPFGCDSEDGDEYSPTLSRLLVYAEIHNCDNHRHGTFSTPVLEMPYTYAQLQQWIVERRRRLACVASDDRARELVQSAEDLATKLQEFASEGIVVKHLAEFALPPKKKDSAVMVTPLSEEATAPQATKRLKAHDDSDKGAHAITLSPQTATAMADSFFKFVQKDHLQPHLAGMRAGQILTLCIFHSRLSWQKGKPIELLERDQYWLPLPVYTPAEKVSAPSPPYFVQQLQADATARCAPQIQPPRTCCLCGKGFIDPPALWNHCEAEHHSWSEAVKRMLWEADQLESIPLLSPDKRRIIQNFTAALTYSKPAQAHFGRDKACMRQLLGCATCAKVDWIEDFYPCYLFKECPEVILPNCDDEAAEGSRRFQRR